MCDPLSHLFLNQLCVLTLCALSQVLEVVADQGQVSNAAVCAQGRSTNCQLAFTSVVISMQQMFGPFFATQQKGLKLYMHLSQHSWHVHTCF